MIKSLEIFCRKMLSEPTRVKFTNKVTQLLNGKLQFFFLKHINVTSSSCIKILFLIKKKKNNNRHYLKRSFQLLTIIATKLYLKLKNFYRFLRHFQLSTRALTWKIAQITLIYLLVKFQIVHSHPYFHPPPSRLNHDLLS